MPQRSWGSLAGSTGLHVVLLLLAIELTRRPAELERKPEPAPEDPGRRVEMVYLEPPPAPRPPPPPPPAPAPQPAPVRPPTSAPPPVNQPIPESQANAPPDAVRSKGSEDETDDPVGATAPPPPRAEAAPTLESEARRIFGRPRLGPRPGAGPRSVRPMEAYRPDRPDQCVPHPSAPADSAVVQFGTVVGRIFRQNDGRPLAGAHLQMLGTPYVTFTDGEGVYRFRFDLSLVDNCRSQYVRVSAPGYESRLLVLVVGQNVQSEDVALRKR